MNRLTAGRELKDKKYTWHLLKSLIIERSKDTGMSRLNPNLTLEVVIDIMLSAIEKFEPNSFPNCNIGTEKIQAMNILRECL